MNSRGFVTICFLVTLSGSAFAQSVPPPPTPVAESDLRDNTIKMRSIDLERVKRDAMKIRPDGPTKEQEIRFAETKEKFEGIQKLQESIVKAYTNGRRIDFSEISKSASEIRTSSLWLDENLFGGIPEEENKNGETESAKSKSVRDLIIELDNAIGSFVQSPVFQDTKVVDTKISKQAQAELRNIIMLSGLLSSEAEKQK